MINRRDSNVQYVDDIAVNAIIVPLGTVPYVYNGLIGNEKKKEVILKCIPIDSDLIQLFNTFTNTLRFKLKSIKNAILEINDTFWYHEYTNSKNESDKEYKYTNNENLKEYCLSDYVRYNWVYSIQKSNKKCH